MNIRVCFLFKGQKDPLEVCDESSSTPLKLWPVAMLTSKWPARFLGLARSVLTLIFEGLVWTRQFQTRWENCDLWWTSLVWICDLVLWNIVAGKEVKTRKSSLYWSALVWIRGSVHLVLWKVLVNQLKRFAYVFKHFKGGLWINVYTDRQFQTRWENCDLWWTF